MKWNERLRHERKSQGWTQKLLAEKIGTSTYTVNRWENGNTFPSPFYREKLSQIFGLDFEDSELLEADLARSKNTRKEAPLPWEGGTQHAPSYHQEVSTLVGKTTPQLDLLWEANENNSEEDALSPVAQLASPDIPAEASLLMDPTIPQALDNVSHLLGRHDLLVQARQRLLATDNLGVTVRPRFLRNIRLSRIKSLFTWELVNRFFWGSQLILSIVVIAVSLLAFHRLSLPNNVSMTKSLTSPSGTSYEAEAPENTRTGGARMISRSNCSGGKRVGYIGKGGTLQFNDIEGESTSNYELTIYYVMAGTDMPTMYTTVNSDPAKVFNLPSTGNSNMVRIFTITVQLNAGRNTIMFFNPSSYGPDIDRIVVRRI